MTSLNPIEKKPLCRQGYTCVILCISQNCTIRNPFICANCITQPCYIDHKNCRKQLFQTFTERLMNYQPKSQGFKQLQACVLKLITTLSKMIQQSKSSFSKWLRQYYYSYDVMKILNCINDGSHNTLTGNQMFYIYKSSLVPIEEQYKFNRYYNKKAEGIVSFMKALQQNILGMYDHKVDALDLSSFEISQDREGDITFDVEVNRNILEVRKPVITRKNRHKVEDMDKGIDWRTLHLEREINLEAKLLEHNQFSKISRVNFENTKVLKLSNNEIGSIEWMRGLVMHSLTELCLDYNKIEDITPLENLFLPSLRGLHLQYNQIRQIVSLTKLHVPYLQILNLNYNQIQSIQPFQKCKFQELRRLYLHDNKIKSAMPLFRMKHSPNLQFISLQMNNLPYKNDDFRKLIYAIKGQYFNLSIRTENSQLLQD